MDLLGDYSSSDDEVGQKSLSPPILIIGQQQQKQQEKKGILKPISSTTKAAPQPQKALPVTAAAATSTATKATKRGKKILSLHSVLPPHILEQLTKAETGGGDDDDDSSDNDDEDSAALQRKRDDNKMKKNKAASFSTEDEGIANFLSALHSAKTSNTKKTKNSTTKGYSDSANNKTATKQDSSSSELGAAFMMSTTTTTTTTNTTSRKKVDGGSPAVIDIHSNKSPPTGRETPSGQQHDPAASPSGYQPLSLSPGTAFRPFQNNNTKMTVVSHSAICSAPPVPGMTSAAIQKSTISRGPTITKNAVPQYNPRSSATVASTATTTTTTGNVTAAYAPAERDHEEELSTVVNQRRNKRQMQKALRAGQLDQALTGSHAVASNVHVTSMDQVHPTDYVPQPETYATASGGVNGVKVAATTMYNPQAGSDVQADLAAQRAKGKNQINALMASAANFQLQQTRMGGGGNKTNNNSQRAGAKRKYGW